ncbi:hypothetical protein BV25DRAFT_1480742 [Artomyces pyxidatus]|uniref:Uncharacterized protein n=1 Tax=Artomyces pyxidatus TaxID=48021 RepID=A0ACB8SKP2_9AGAM|nr:hypothetical protein BV25DRAFT_1480742 [Artomyces pyxidatus]
MAQLLNTVKLDISPNRNEDKAHADVWGLSANTELDLQMLSWQMRPVQAALVGRLSASFNETDQLPSLSCRSGSYQAFEQ